MGSKVGWLVFYASFTYLLYQWSQAATEGEFMQTLLLFFTYINAYSFFQELLLLGTLAYATAQFAQNPVLLDAVREIAGADPELPALNVEPQKVVNAIKVFNSLQVLNTRLKDLAFDPSPLDALSSMLLLSQNADVDELCELTDDAGNEKEACIADLDTAAKIFSHYDINGDQKLASDEFRVMLSDVGLKLDDAEVTEAIQMLGAANKDYVRFDEFITFWRNKIDEPVITASLFDFERESSGPADNKE